MSVWCDRTVTGGILFLILFTPFAFGSVHPWAFSIMEALIFLLVVVWMVKLAIVGVQGVGARLTPDASRLTIVALPLTLFLVLVLFQMMPLPPSFLRVLSPQTYELYTRSLPGWPSEIPYGNLVGGKEQGGQRAEGRGRRSEVGGQRSEVRGQRAEVSGQRSEVRGQTSEVSRPPSPVLLPTPDEVRRGVPVPFSQPEDFNPVPAPLPAPIFSLPALRSLLPETWLPLSVAPALTRTDLLKFMAYTALFFLLWLYPVGDALQLAGAPFARPSRRQLEERFFRSLVLVVLVAGLLIAAIGFVQRFTWNGKILWFFIPYDWGTETSHGLARASGSFINPDHFANYLALIFPIALACALFRTSVLSKPLEQAFRVFCAFTALLVFTGILLSLSRSGWISTLLGIVLLLWFSPWQSEEGLPALFKKRMTPVARGAIIIVCILLLVSLFFVGPGGREQVDARLGETFTQDTGLWGRTAIWKDSLPMIRDFPLFGVGLGAWPELFMRYQSAPWSAGFYREAHNDYVELLAETGVIGFGLLAWFFVWGGTRLVQGLKKTSTRAVSLMAAVLAALGVMAFHELFDFNLQIPANAFLFTLLFALGLRMTGSREQGARSSDQLGAFQSPRFPALQPAIVSVIAVVLVVLALRQEQIPYPHNLKEPVSMAEAGELLLSHPARASSHFSLLRLMGDQPPLAWRLSESEAALWLAPSNPYVRDLYASTLLRMGKTAEGLSEITQSLINSPSLSTHFYLSEKLLPWLSAAEQKAVEEGLKQALVRGYPESLGSLAGFYARLGRFSDQGTLYEHAGLTEQDGAKRAQLLLNAGLAYANAQNQAKAEILFHNAITTLPADPRAYQHLATAIYGVRKDLAGAKEIVAKGIKNGAPAFALYLALAEAANKAGRPEDSKAALNSAKTEIEQSSRQGQEPFPLYLLLADAARMAGNRDEEKVALLAAVDLRPRSSDTLFRLASIYMQENNFDRAAFYYRKIATINPNSADVYYQLAVAEEGRYGFAAAEKAYARAVELAPDNKGIQSRYEELKRKVAQSRKDAVTK